MFHIFIIILLEYDEEYPDIVSKTYTIKALWYTDNKPGCALHGRGSETQNTSRKLARPHRSDLN